MSSGVEQEAVGVVHWALGGLAALFAGGYAHIFKRTDGLSKESREDRAEIWRRLDEIADTRVKHGDLMDLKAKQDEMLDEVRIVRANLHDVSNIVHVLQGRLQRPAGDAP